MKRATGTIPGILGTLTITAVLVAVGPPEFEISRSTIDGGGAMRSTGGDFEVSGTIGQADAGALSGDDFTLTGGFWVELVPGDCNEDGGINVFDHHAFAPCMNGPNSDLFDAGCVCFDADRNDTVDLRDAAMFQNSINAAP